MPVGAIPPSAGIPDTGLSTESLKKSRAASDFESLLIAQMLKSSRTEGSGWLGSGDDGASDTAFGLGEEELAKALASTGGFGLSKLIQSGLNTREAHTQASVEAPATNETGR